MIKQYRHMNMTFHSTDIQGVFYVFSYTTHVATLDNNNKLIVEWGHGKYSRTTSKQITILCNEYCLKGYTIVHLKESPKGIKD